MLRSVAQAENGCCVTCSGGFGPSVRHMCIPVSTSRSGDRGTVVRISGKEETKRFLAGLGFTAGATVYTVSEINGSLILEVKGSKVAIDRDMASKIMVSPEN